METEQMSAVEQYKGEGPWTVRERREAVAAGRPLVTIAIDDRHLPERAGEPQRLLIHTRGPANPEWGRMVRRLFQAQAIDFKATCARVIAVLDDIIAGR